MNEIRVLPEPHKYAICAPEGLPIKKFYEGFFEEVYVFYHPFIKPNTIDYELFNPKTYPSRNDIRNNCERVTWESFMQLAGIKSFKKLDIGLRTNILGLKKQFQDEKAAQLILEAYEKYKIVEPNAGSFPEFIMNDLLRAIQVMGQDWIWYGDEFCTERKLEYIEELINDNNMLDERKNLFTHDHNILITTHWDSHFSLLCSDRKTVEQLVSSCKLEGFFCTEETKIYWSLSN
jgi:hypothetical protein